MRISTLVFILSLAVLVYVLFGYPLLLAVLARFKARPIQRAFRRRTVTVIIAVYNGERWIADKLRSVLDLRYPRELLQILVVSDGSDDATDSIVLRFEPEGVELIRVPHGGKPLALNAAMQQARGEILFFTDVRQRLDPDCLARMVECYGDPTVGVVSGELFIAEGDSMDEAHTGLYWKYEKFLRKKLSQIDSIPGATGCIYTIRRQLASPLPPNILVDDMCLPLAAFLRGYRVIIEPSAHAFDSPTSLDTEFRRKVRTLAGVYQILRVFPALLHPSNRMWLHFLSHKVGRVLLPFVLVSIAVSSCMLPAPWRAAAIAVQIAGYGLAALDIVVPEKALLKRLSSPARTFVVMMAAALCACSILFRPADRFWTAATGATTAPKRSD